MFYHRFVTKIGTMAIAFTADKITAVQLPEKNKEALKDVLSMRLGKPVDECAVDETPAFVRKLADQIIEHLEGHPQKFSTKHLDLPHNADSFFAAVYRAAMKIPAGKVVSYKELAEKAGSPHACRAVGQAMARNRFPIVVPCHRVIASGKKAGGFSAHGGIETKQKILAIESPKQQFFYA